METNQSSWRALLINWMLLLHSKEGQAPETLFLAVSIVDQYVSATHAATHAATHDQVSPILLGIVAMWIAAKYEEVHPMSLTHCLDNTEGRVTRTDILNTEILVLTSIEFQLNRPTSLICATQFMSNQGLLFGRKRVAHMTRYLLELALYHEEANQRFSSEELGAGALLVALRATSLGDGTLLTTRCGDNCTSNVFELIKNETVISPPSEIRAACAADWLVALLKRERAEGIPRAVHHKFASRRFSKVAKWLVV